MAEDRDVPRRMTRSGTHQEKWRIRGDNASGVLVGKTGLTSVKVRYLTSAEFSGAANATIDNMDDVTLTALSGAGDIYAGTLAENDKAGLVALATADVPEPEFYAILLSNDERVDYQKYRLVDE